MISSTGMMRSSYVAQTSTNFDMQAVAQAIFVGGVIFGWMYCMVNILTRRERNPRARIKRIQRP